MKAPRKKRETGSPLLKLVLPDVTPETIDVRDLASLLAAFATLAGEEARFSLTDIKRGSTNLAFALPVGIDNKTIDRIASANSSEASPEARKAWREIDTGLEKLKSSATVMYGRKKLLKFPGMGAKGRIGPIKQEEQLAGQIIRAGGKPSSPAVMIETVTGEAIPCSCRKQTAKSLAPYLYGTSVRLTGDATWFREADGSWTRAHFRVRDFEVLLDEPLEVTIERARSAFQPPSSPDRALNEDQTEKTDGNQ